jgi:nucleotide-binding universal stress UspA family protein
LELAPGLVGIEGSDELYERAHERAMTRMREWSEPLSRARLDFEILVEEGGPTEILLNTAARVQAELVIIGRRDRHPFSGTLGSVSQRVLAYSKCPAAIIPQRE